METFGGKNLEDIENLLLENRHWQIHFRILKSFNYFKSNIKKVLGRLTGFNLIFQIIFKITLTK